jgi:CheY-like chemotaxis protein
VTARILLVDDDPAVLALVASRLASGGRYRVHVALGGEEGVRQAKKLAPDLVVCDLQMPGVDGRSLARELRDDPSTESIPLVFLSSVDSDETGRAGSGSQGPPIVSKGAPPGRLEAEIGALLGSTRGGTPAPPGPSELL